MVRMNQRPKRILFLCTGNSCRSQMAEGFLRLLGGPLIESLSAGSKPSGFVHPLAIEAMREAGVDISSQQSKSIRKFVFPGAAPDVVISVCDRAADECPVFPGGEVERLHWPFDDPADVAGDPEEQLHAFRRVRDGIKVAIEAYLST
jgi:arsenate reductase